MVDVFALQQDLQSQAITAAAAVEEKVKSIITSIPPVASEGSAFAVSSILTVFTNEQAYKIVSAWRELLPQLITKYHDGYHAQNLDGSAIEMKKFFYPKFWLESTGYFDNKINAAPGVILFSPNPVESALSSSSSSSVLSFSYSTFILATGTVLLALYGGYVLGKRTSQQYRAYTPIYEEL
jgi:hypothetical protein